MSEQYRRADAEVKRGASGHGARYLSAVTPFAFRTSHESGAARLGLFTTPHGPIETPAFMPVATQGTIKGVSVDEVAAGLL